MASYVRLDRPGVETIGQAYGLRIDSFEPLDGGAGNSSYLIHGPAGDHVLTVIEDKSRTEVEELGRLLLLLEERGFPTTRLVQTEGGEIATRFQGRPVMLKRYVAGLVRRDLSSELLRAIGAAMARLHQVPAPAFLPRRHSYGLEFFPEVVGCGADPTYEAWLERARARLEQRLPAGLPRGLIHGDLFYDNVIVEGDALRAIIDLEEACHMELAFDLGMAIVGLCRDGTSLSLRMAAALVAGYQRARDLEPGERAALQLFVVYAAAATSCWRYWKYNISAPTATLRDRHLVMRGLAQTVDSIPGPEFVAALFDTP